MALNIKDKATEELVAELASLTGETKTRAVREAARERLERIRVAEGLVADPKKDAESMRRFFEMEIRSLVPKDKRGHAPTKAEREEILGYGPEGF